VAVHPWGTGLHDYRLQHCAAPEMALEEVSLQIEFLGRPLGAPIMVSSMTGATAEGERINRNLAAAAERFGLAMGLGSARAAIEDPSCAATYRVRDVAPHVLLFANLGAVQLNYGYDMETCRRIVDLSEADGLILHLNPLQEALQPEGNTDFRGLLGRIEAVCRSVSVPVIVKEVGWGLSADVVRRLAEAGVAAVDVAGAGGTSWSEIEGYRATTGAGQRLAQDFAGWGIPTVECIRAARESAPGLPLIASGGIESGVDAAKAIALGADVAALARVFLAAANESEEQTIEEAERVVSGMRVAMFCAGISNVVALKKAPLFCRGAFGEERVREP
jgi:isopentenyl-diphosphate delta-isomerase